MPISKKPVTRKAVTKTTKSRAAGSRKIETKNNAGFEKKKFLVMSGVLVLAVMTLFTGYGLSLRQQASAAGSVSGMQNLGSDGRATFYGCKVNNLQMKAAVKFGSGTYPANTTTSISLSGNFANAPYSKGVVLSLYGTGVAKAYFKYSIYPKNSNKNEITNTKLLDTSKLAQCK